MAIEHLVFNRLKWFNVADNADITTINGRNYEAVPKSFTIPAGKKLYSYVIANDNGTLRLPEAVAIASPNTQVSCIGTDDWKNLGRYYSIIYDNGNGKNYLHVNASDVQNVKWGGRTRLNTLLARLGAAFRKVVPVC